MKLIKVVLVALVLFVNLFVAQYSWADPISEKSPDYPEITQTLNNLLQAKANPKDSGYSAEDLQQKIAALQFQKYIMESTEDWGVCSNQTNKTIGVYAHKPKKHSAASENTLYYLGAGETTDDDWDCDGVYLPNGVKAGGLVGDAAGAVKIVDGTRLVVSSNPATGEIEFNAPLAQAFKAGEGNWSIPDLSQADIDAQVPNAPID
ncbi:MAG: hypothetical protein ACRDEA_20140 [Microcystaceae cyanobacterium]